MNIQQKRIAELEQLAREEGITLPMGAATIARHESHGRYVDLTTGSIGDAEERISLTVLGEATAVVNNVE